MPGSTEPKKKTVFSPLAALSPEIHALFVKLENMLAFGPHVLLLNFYIIPVDEEEVVTTQLVSLSYWNKKKKTFEKSQPQPYHEFVQQLHLAHEFQNLSAMVEEQLDKEKKQAAARRAKSANVISPLVPTQSLLAALDRGDLTQQQLMELALQQVEDIKGIKKRDAKAARKDQDNPNNAEE